MQQQFLVNADGSWPSGTSQFTIDYLTSNNIPLVRPTPRWVPQPGFMFEERDAERDAEGIWRQVWVEVPIPEPDPVPEMPAASWMFPRNFSLDELSAMRDLAVQNQDAQTWADALMANGYVQMTV